ncbi:MAG: NAD-dependent epimerase/dehydratase family protein [Acidobacteria bacterium]|nr:MAG: NAD-dependent epimerase/dehydratase family protein [Acidobacteriota bacterium]
MGTAVAERLRKAGHRLSGLARSDSAAEQLHAAAVQPVRGDLADAATVGAAARAADATISMASASHAQVDGPAVDAILAALSGSDKPFIYTDGIWSFGDTGGVVADEDTPPKPIPMVQWRLAVVERVLLATRLRIRTVVIRPGMVYGRGGGIPAGFAESARKEGAARVVGTGENRWTMVHVEDLADLYLLALEQAPAGVLLVGVGVESVKVRELAAAASRGADADGRIFTWPLDEARMELGQHADALALDQQASGTRARKILGWHPHGPDPLEDLERGSYVSFARRAVS